MPAPEDDGLAFVYCECGPDVTEREFNNWCDNEDIPPRLALPGASSVIRYKAIDGKRPSWLAIYDTANLGVFGSDEYKELMANTSESEKFTMSRLVTLNRRMYTRLTAVRNPDCDPP